MSGQRRLALGESQSFFAKQDDGLYYTNRPRGAHPMDLTEYHLARSVATKAVEFLKGRQTSEGWMKEEDGEPSKNLTCYYKAIWAFESAGELARANAVADILSETFMRKSGDFGSEEQRKGEEWFEWRYRAYPNIWVIIGAHKIGRFDLSVPGAGFLLSYQDPKSGGFCNEAPYPKGGGLEDSLTTSACGLAVLTAGRVEEASRAGDFLVRLVDDQPEVKERFYAAYDARKRGLVRQFEEPEAVFRVVETDIKEQFYFMVGLPIAFLAKLYLATRDRRYLAAAKEYYAFTRRCTDYAYHYPASGKSGFAAAILSRISGSREVADSARDQLTFYSETQARTGSWPRFPGLKLYGDGATSSIAGQLDITAEFVAWINEMLQELK